MPDSWDKRFAGFKEKHGLTPPPPPTPNGEVVPIGDGSDLPHIWFLNGLRNECEKMRTAKPRTRNDTLNKTAMAIGGLVAKGHFTRDIAEEHLRAAAYEAWGSEADLREIEATMKSGMDAGIRKDNRQLPRSTLAPQIENVVTLPTLNGQSNGQEPAAEADPDLAAIWNGTDGATFVLDIPDTIPALWGSDERVLWAEGEALMIAGGQGLGKTTLAGQLVRAQLLGGKLLDLPVTQTTTKILYLAMDRPRQIARSLHRQFDETHRDILANQLIVRPGPPLVDMAKDMTLLVRMAAYFDAGIIYVDSLKDAVIGLSTDEVAAAYNRARQYALNSSLQICELHHNVKHGPQGSDPKSIADIYGSTWLTSGCGSVLMLTGEPGDPVMNFRHLKQPAEEIGPYRLRHDQLRGELTIEHATDLVSLAVAAQPEGLSAKAAAMNLFDTETPTPGEIEKARRQLERKAAEGWLIQQDGAFGGVPTATVWFPIVDREAR